MLTVLYVFNEILNFFWKDLKKLDECAKPRSIIRASSVKVPTRKASAVRKQSSMNDSVSRGFDEANMIQQKSINSINSNKNLSKSGNKLQIDENNAKLNKNSKISMLLNIKNSNNSKINEEKQINERTKDVYINTNEISKNISPNATHFSPVVAVKIRTIDDTDTESDITKF